MKKNNNRQRPTKKPRPTNNAKPVVEKVSRDEHLAELDSLVAELNTLSGFYITTLDTYKAIIDNGQLSADNADMDELLITVNTMVSDFQVLQSEKARLDVEVAEVKAIEVTDAFSWLPQTIALYEQIQSVLETQSEIYTLSHQTLLTYDY